MNHIERAYENWICTVLNLRLAVGMSQSELSKISKVSQASISKFEAGVHEVGILTFIRLNWYLRLAVETMFDTD